MEAVIANEQKHYEEALSIIHAILNSLSMVLWEDKGNKIDRRKGKQIIIQTFWEFFKKF